jgi:hypothetical protein
MFVYIAQEFRVDNMVICGRLRFAKNQESIIIERSDFSCLLRSNLYEYSLVV